MPANIEKSVAPDESVKVDFRLPKAADNCDWVGLWDAKIFF